METLEQVLQHKFDEYFVNPPFDAPLLPREAGGFLKKLGLGGALWSGASSAPARGWQLLEIFCPGVDLSGPRGHLFIYRDAWNGEVSLRLFISADDKGEFEKAVLEAIADSA